MNEQTLISEINKILKAQWSKKQTAKGKWIEVKWEWRKFIDRAANKYAECGWDVKKHAEIGPKGRKVWLVFVNPGWSTGEIKEVPH